MAKNSEEENRRTDLIVWEKLSWKNLLPVVGCQIVVVSPEAKAAQRGFELQFALWGTFWSVPLEQLHQNEKANLWPINYPGGDYPRWVTVAQYLGPQVVKLFDMSATMGSKIWRLGSKQQQMGCHVLVTYFIGKWLCHGMCCKCAIHLKMNKHKGVSKTNMCLWSPKIRSQMTLLLKDTFIYQLLI